MLNSLSKKNSVLWRQLGNNWMTTRLANAVAMKPVVMVTLHSDHWPASRGPVPVYMVKFSDGCMPPNLHNSSDCPSNFPTLDSIPVNQRGVDYSDAYDEDYKVVTIDQDQLLLMQLLLEEYYNKLLIPCVYVRMLVTQ